MGFCLRGWRRRSGVFDDDERVLSGVLLVVVGVLWVLLSSWGSVCFNRWALRRHVAVVFLVSYLALLGAICGINAYFSFDLCCLVIWFSSLQFVLA